MKLDCLNKMDLLVPGPDERGGRVMVCLLLLLCLGHCLPAVLGEDLSIDCHAGGIVTMPCYGAAATDTKEVDVMWKFNNIPACWYKNGEWCETVNRTELGSIRQNNFSLIINTVRNEDEGVYTCEISEDKKQTIHLVVKGGRKRRDSVKMANSDPACRPYIDREDPPGSETNHKQDSDENLPGLPSGGNSVVTGVIVGIVITVAMVGAALFTRRLWNQQRDKKLPNPRPSQSPLIKDASVYIEGYSTDKKMGEPAV